MRPSTGSLGRPHQVDPHRVQYPICFHPHSLRCAFHRTLHRAPFLRRAQHQHHSMDVEDQPRYTRLHIHLQVQLNPIVVVIVKWPQTAFASFQAAVTRDLPRLLLIRLGLAHRDRTSRLLIPPPAPSLQFPKPHLLLPPPLSKTISSGTALVAALLAQFTEVSTG